MKNTFPLLVLILTSLQLQAQPILTAIAGNGTRGYNGDNGYCLSAQLNNPAGINFDKTGNIMFIADATNNAIRKVNQYQITTIAGNGNQGYTGDNGPALQATLGAPVSSAFDAKGNLFIADQYNNAIRKIDTAGIITTFASNLLYPSGLVFDALGNLYVTQQTGYLISKIDTAGNITTIAGTGNGPDNGDNGPATEANISDPYGICFDANGNLYFTESWENKVRRIDTKGIITTVAGNGTAGYNGDGIAATAAELNQPEGVVFDVDGNMYIADGLNGRVRMVNTSGIISSYIGPGGYIDDSLFFASAVAFDAPMFDDVLYIADAGRDQIFIAAPFISTGATTPNRVTAKVFPNPVSDVLHISGNAGAGTATVTNVEGEVLYQGHFTSSDFEIPVSGFPAAMYFISISTSNSRVVKDWVKRE